MHNPIFNVKQAAGWIAISILPVFLFVSIPVNSQTLTGSKDSTTLTILFAGDVMGHGPQIQAAKNDSTGQYNYDTCFFLIKPVIQKADLAIANLEVTLAGPPYSGYPQFSSPDALPLALKQAGFDILVTANNHAADRGKAGIRRTIRVLDSLGIGHTGTFADSMQRDTLYPLIIEKNGFRLALLNYTYGTNGLPVPAPAIVNVIDTGTMLYDLQLAAAMHPDMIISVMHWGEEYERFPNSFQKRIARFLFNHGCDLVIGSHPHVIQPTEEFFPDPSDSSHLQLVLYSLGNCISNQSQRYRNGGLMFEVTLKKDHGTRISDCRFLPVWVYRKNPGGKTRYFLLPDGAAHEMLGLSGEEENSFNEFVNDTRAHLPGVKEMDVAGQLQH